MRYGMFVIPTSRALWQNARARGGSTLRSRHFRTGRLVAVGRLTRSFSARRVSASSRAWSGEQVSCSPSILTQAVLEIALSQSRSYENRTYPGWIEASSSGGSVIFVLRKAGNAQARASI